MAISNKAIFFDRDGTLIKSRIIDGKLIAFRDIFDFNIATDARKILLELKSRGYKLILVTNQPDVSRGLVTKFFVDNINDFLKMHLELDLIKVVYQLEEDDPERYKPAPGMLLEAAAELDLDLEKSFMVGDRWRDIDAGKNANCKTVLINSQNIEGIRHKPDFVIDELAELLEIIY
jgi:D-glycero-D-manno-heptose 1,7-bisphosphate phosphatase